jgi:hypothetical protein
MGRAAVEAELGRRSGHPTELIDDIGGEPPFPTRQFCEQWCIAQDNMPFHFSLRMGIILILIVGIVASMVMATGDFARLSAGSPAGRQAATGGAPGFRGTSGGIYDVPAFRPGTPSRQQSQPQQHQQQRQ